MILCFSLSEKFRCVTGFEKTGKKTLINWQTEIMNSVVFNYSNGFLEGINNLTKEIKRNAFGYRSLIVLEVGFYYIINLSILELILVR